MSTNEININIRDLTTGQSTAGKAGSAPKELKQILNVLSAIKTESSKKDPTLLKLISIIEPLARKFKIAPMPGTTLAPKATPSIPKTQIESMIKGVVGETAKRLANTPSMANKGITQTNFDKVIKNQTSELVKAIVKQLGGRVSIDKTSLNELTTGITNTLRGLFATKTGAPSRETKEMNRTFREIVRATKSNTKAIEKLASGPRATPQNIDAKIIAAEEKATKATNLLTEATKKHTAEVSKLSSNIDDLQKALKNLITSQSKKATQTIERKYPLFSARPVDSPHASSPSTPSKAVVKGTVNVSKLNKLVEKIEREMEFLAGKISSLVSSLPKDNDMKLELESYFKNLQQAHRTKGPGAISNVASGFMNRQFKGLEDSSDSFKLIVKAANEFMNTMTDAGKYGEGISSAFQNLRTEIFKGGKDISEATGVLKKNIVATVKYYQRMIKSLETGTSDLEGLSGLKSELSKLKSMMKLGDFKDLAEEARQLALTFRNVGELDAPLNAFIQSIYEVNKKTKNIKDIELVIRKTVENLGSFESIIDDYKGAVAEETIQTKKLAAAKKKAAEDLEKSKVIMTSATMPRAGGMARSTRYTTADRVKQLRDQESRFQESLILPGGMDLKDVKGGYGKDIRKAVQSRVNELSKSLDLLQKDIITSLEKGFDEHQKKWKVVGKKFEPGFIGSDEKMAKEWRLQIANMGKMQAELNKMSSYYKKTPKIQDPQQMIDVFIKERKGKMVSEVQLDKDRATKVGEWLKGKTEEDLSNFTTLSDAAKTSLKIIKEKFKEEKGQAVGTEMRKAIVDLLGSRLEGVFAETFAADKIQRELLDENLVRTVSLPAARLSKTGTTSFKTKHGSERALPRFATYKTGFENLYEKMLQEGGFPREGSGPFAADIQKLPLRPKKESLGEAKNLAKKLLTQYTANVPESGQFLKEQYKEAGVLVGAKFQKAGLEKKGLGSFAKDIENAVNRFSADVTGNVEEITRFMNQMENLGVTAYDVVKSLESIKFENVYDIYRKTLAIPVKEITEAPQFVSRMREYEKAMRQMRDIMPISEPDRPRRGKHQEDTLITLFQTSQLWKGSPIVTKGRGGLKPREQQQRIQDINMNIRDMFNEYEELNKYFDETGAAGLKEQFQTQMPYLTKRRGRYKKAVPEGVTSASSLGLTEEQASTYQEFRKGSGLAGKKSFAPLDATMMKTYTEKLMKQAPFGEFNRLGRQVSYVTNAMSSMENAIEGFDETVRTTTPSFRTTKERDLIESGRQGKAGYGFNVLAELHHTASTFEDQVVISGQLAKALTQAVSVLVKPGRPMPPIGPEKVTDIIEKGEDTKTLRDIKGDVSKAASEIMKVLGVPQYYEKDADKALIDEIRNVTITQQGKPIEVQEAKLAEAFLGYFGRKFTTRYGSKGVSVTPTGGKGLGTADMPKTMGQLGSELIDTMMETKKLRKKAMKFEIPEYGYDFSPKAAKILQDQLITSGNKFMISMFSDASDKLAQSVGVKEEIEQQGEIYKKFTGLIKQVYGEDLPKDVAGIKDLTGLYKTEAKEPKLTEPREIDVRISARGIAKRGLQGEFLESIIGNVIGISPEGLEKGAATTVQPRMKQDIYDRLLVESGQGRGGEFAQLSKELGYKSATGEDTKEMQKNIYKRLVAQKGEPEPGKEKEEMEALAAKAAALEAVSNYYVKVKDEYGKESKKIVGPKFMQIIEEPHQFKQWGKDEIERTMVGEKLNLPAYAAYAAVFGEQSELMNEIDKSYSHESKRAMEYVRALEMMSSKKIPQGIPKVELGKLGRFEERSGVFSGEEEDTKKRLRGTIMDVEKYPTPFTVDLPTGKETEPEPFYVPGALSRGVFKESMLAGEYSMESVTRRIQNVIEAARDVQDSITGEIFDEDVIRQALPARVAKEVKSARGKGLASMTETLNRFYQGLSDQPVEEAFRMEKFGEAGGAYPAAGEAYPEGITEKEYISEYLNRWRGRDTETGAVDKALRRTADVLVGVRPEEGAGKGEVRPEFLAAKSRMAKELERGRESWEGGKYGRELVDKLGIKLTDEDMIEKNLVKLQRAKIEYMQELARNLLGKKGAIGEAVFQRKIPAAYGKATVAITDKTDELKNFANFLAKEKTLKGIEQFIDPQEFKEYTDALQDITKEHAEFVEKSGKIGIPVLKEYELGISAKKAKTIPVKFAKKWKKGKGKQYESDPHAKELSRSLYDLLEYRDELSRSVAATFKAYATVEERLKGLSEKKRAEAKEKIRGGEKVKGLKHVPEEGALGVSKQIQEFMEKELQPYVETVRFPFTGVSTLQPYKAKLLGSKYKTPLTDKEDKPIPGKTRDLASFAFMAPGVPEMRMFGEEEGKIGFVQIITQLEKIRDAATKERESLRVREDRGDVIDADELKSLSALISNLNEEITKVIPKYAAIQQKLDFDGDAIEAHSAATVQAREDIAEHFRSFVMAPRSGAYETGRGTTEAAWRTERGWSEAKVGSTSGKYPLADIMTQYEGKWAKPGGEYEFLKKPDITETLEYLKPEQRLEALGEGDISKMTSELISAIEASFTGGKAEEMTAAVDMAARDANANAMSLLEAMKAFSVDERKLLDFTVKESLYEKKYNDAILAQIYKMHVGLETESVYRLHRLGERATGFGAGVIKPARTSDDPSTYDPYRSTPEFKKRWPKSKLFGKAGRVFPETEFQSFMNELERFSTQKGMDVKLSGDKAVAGEVVSSLSRGASGVDDLLTQIGLLGNAAEDDYEELKDFAMLSEKVIRERIGTLPTEQIMQEVKKISTARDLKPVRTTDRESAIKKAVELIGFEGFLKELAYQIEKETEEALVAELESLTPEARRQRKKGPHAGLPTRDWAKEEIRWRQEQGEGIDLPRTTRGTMPLYGFRGVGTTPKSVTGQYRQRGGSVDLPPEIEKLDDEELKERYRQAVAVSKSIKDMFKQSAESKAGGAYSEMVLGTIQNLQTVQEELSRDLSFLRKEKFPFGEKRAIPEAVLGMEAKGPEPMETAALEQLGGDFAAMMQSVLNFRVEAKSVDGFLNSVSGLFRKLDEMRKNVDTYSEKVGIPPIREDIKRNIETEYTEFEKQAEDLFKVEIDPEMDKAEQDKEKEKVKDAKTKYVAFLRAKAEALIQMDKAIEALLVRSKTEEGFLQRMFPSKAAATQARRPDVIETAIKKVPLATGQAQQITESVAEAAASGVTGAIGDRGRPGIPAYAGKIPSGGEPLPVFLAGVATDAFSNVSFPSGTLQNIVGVAGVGTGGYDSSELSRLAKNMSDEMETTQTSFEKIYRASAIKGGGKYGYKGKFGEEFKEKQIEEIMKVMTGKEEDVSEFVKASALLGDAIHAVLGKGIKKEAEGTTTEVELERYIEILDKTFGAITGHIDVFQQKFSEDTQELLESKIVDIKTVHGDVVDRLRELSDSGLTLGALGEIEGLDFLSASDMRKLEEVASQLNIYMKGIEAATGVAADAMKAEAWFVDKENIENIAKVDFGFDATRYARDIGAITEARSRLSTAGEEFAGMSSLTDLRAKERRRAGTEPGERGGKSPLSDKETERFHEMAYARYKEVQAFPDAYDQMRSRASSSVRKPPPVPTGAYGSRLKEYKFAPQPRPEDDMIALMENLRTMHSLAQEYWKAEAGVGTAAGYESLHGDIKTGLDQAKKMGSAAGQEFQNIVTTLRQGSEISGREVITAWKYYRIAVGDFFLNKAEEANELRKEMEAVQDDEKSREAYYEMEANVRGMQKFAEKGLGKRTDIYTRYRKFIDPDFAMATGLYKSPQDLMEQAKMPLGDAPKLEKLFTETVVGDVTEGKELVPPIDKVRKIFQELTGSSKEANKEWISLLSKGDKFKRLGDTVLEAWELRGFVENIAKVRGSLETFLKFRFDEGEDIVERKNLEETLKLIKSIENAYAALNTERLMGEGLTGTREDWGQLALLKVPRTLAPQEQLALHKRNVQQVRGYFKKTEEEGGPEVGERYIYPIKVIGEAGDVVKNIAYDFKKYGDSVNYAGEKVGIFQESQRDLMEFMQGANTTFTSAIMRAVRWGAASKLVYGGARNIVDSIDLLADVETGLAQLRMVMSPLETDFDAMGKAAIGFAKQYGVPMTDVLSGMRIFAQQGLKQGEVIDRTQTATLASNVTTLSATEATEALTAAMKVFRMEGEGSMRFMDAWSEVEAKHAITADKMANALKKAAAAAKNAGFDFDELNGIITGIGSVTRQTGKEIGTSLRFIFRRLTTEKAPKELGKIGIPVLEDTGELRRGFDILSDLAMKWDDLTSAQRMNIAQSIGGTRQYNSLLVLMDNWGEALDTITDSVNSKGSAERRNLELMKTYNKQLEQMKAAAVEVHVAFGKIAMPFGKAAVQSIRALLEVITETPAALKYLVVGLVGLSTYIIKGADAIDYFTDRWRQGKSIVDEITGLLGQEMKITSFELLGKGEPDFVKGLKTLKAYKLNIPVTIGEGDEDQSTKFTEQGRRLKDFQSAGAKTVLWLKMLGEGYNAFLADMVGTGAIIGDIKGPLDLLSKGLDVVSGSLTKAAISLDLMAASGTGGLASVIPGMVATVGAAATATASDASAVVGQAAEFVGEKFGETGKAMVEKFASENTGLVAAVAPLAATLLALGPIIDSLSGYYNTISKSAQDYEKAAYGVRRAQDSELKTVRGLIGEYDSLQRSLDEVAKVSDPATKARRQELGTYESPLTLMTDVTTDSTDMANRLAETNVNLVAGYDKLGNAVLKTAGDFKTYLSVLEDVKLKEMAKTEVEIAVKFITGLTETEGPEKWKYELRELAKEAPIIGNLIAKGIKVSPAKAMSVVTGRLNDLLQAKNKFPMSTAFDKDISKYQGKLKEVRKGFGETYGDFKRILSDIETKGLSKDDIAKLFGTEELRKGYELMIDVEPRFNLKETKGKMEWQDVLGAEVMRRSFPSFAATFDASATLTKARLETAGAVEREGKAMSGDIVFLLDEIAEKYNIAGNQAIISLKETTDGVFEWFVEYFNTKTLRVEERPFAGNFEDMVESIFPVNRIEEDLAERLDSLNSFVAGASAGLRGIDPKRFKKDFTLGERFFSEIPTTTILQGAQGFTPGGGGGFGASEYQKDWKETTETFFFKPMREYRLQMEQLEKLRLEGLQGGQVTIAKGMYDELTKLQNILKNNQVVLQYRAVFVDLMKTMEQGSRVLKESLVVEKSRQGLQKGVAGYLKDVPTGFDNLNTGVQQFTDLTVKQRALISRRGYEPSAARLGELGIRKEAAEEQVFGMDRALVALQSISDVSEGFGAALTADEMKKYVEIIAQTDDKGAQSIAIETSKVVDNTASTVERLDDIIANMGADEEISKKFSPEEFGGLDFKTFVTKMKENLPDTETSFFNQRDRLWGSENEVAFNRDIQPLVDLQEKGNKEQWISSKDIAKATAATTALASINKLGYDRMIEQLEAQKAQTAEGSKERQDIESAIQKAREGSFAEGIIGQDNWETTQAASAMTTAMTLFAKETGMTENEIKVLGAATAGLTVAFNKLSGGGAPEKGLQSGGLITGPGGPTDDKINLRASAGEYVIKASSTNKLGEKALNYINKYGKIPPGYQEGGKVSRGLLENLWNWKGFVGDGPSLADISKKLKEEYEESGIEDLMIRVSNGEYIIKQPSAKKLGYGNLNFMNEFGEMPAFAEGGVVGGATGGTTTGDKPITVNLSESTISRFKQILLPYLAITATGYVAEKSEDETRLATLNAQAEEQAELFSQILEKYPEASAKVVADLKGTKDNLDRVVTEAATIEKPLVLDTEKERRKVADDITSIRKELIKEHEKIAEEMSEVADKLARLEIAEQFKMEVEELERAMREIDIASNVGRAIESSFLEYDFSSAFGGGIVMRTLFDQWSGNIADIMEDRIEDATGPKFPRAGGALAGKYKPKPIDYGIESVSGMTPEEYLVATDKRVAYKPSAKQFFTQEVSGAQRGEAGVTTLLKDVLAGRTAGVSKVRSAEDMFRKLDLDQQKLNVSQSKLVEYMAKREELRAREGFFGTGLSAAEGEELEQLDERIEDLGDGLVELTDDIGRAKDALKDSLQEAADIIKQRNVAFKALGEASEYNINRLFGSSSVLNKGLKGFSGGYELPVSRREMSPQQRLYSQADPDFAGKMEGYAYGLNVLLPSMRQNLSALVAEQQKLIEKSGDNSERYKELTKQIEVSEGALKEFTEGLKEFGEVAVVIQKISEVLNQFKFALQDLRLKEVVEDLPGIKRYREEMGKLLGGGDPLALQTVSAAESRRSQQTSTPLGPYANQFDKRRAQIQYEIGTGLTGAASIEKQRELRDVDVDESRALLARDQLRENEKLKAQGEEFISAMYQLSDLLKNENIAPEQGQEIFNLMKDFSNVLSGFADVTTQQEKIRKAEESFKAGGISSQDLANLTASYVREGVAQYKGGAEQQYVLTKAMEDMLTRLKVQAPDLKIGVEKDPIVSELRKQTDLLQKIAMEGFGLSREDVGLKPEGLFASIKKALGFGTTQNEKQSGGRIFGAGGPREDKVPAMLSPGEYVIRAASAQKIGYGALSHMNAKGMISGFAEGGMPGFAGLSRETLEEKLTKLHRLDTMADYDSSEKYRQSLSTESKETLIKKLNMLRELDARMEEKRAKHKSFADGGATTKEGTPFEQMQKGFKKSTSDPWQQLKELIKKLWKRGKKHISGPTAVTAVRLAEGGMLGKPLLGFRTIQDVYDRINLEAKAIAKERVKQAFGGEEVTAAMNEQGFKQKASRKLDSEEYKKYEKSASGDIVGPGILERTTEARQSDFNIRTGMGEQYGGAKIPGAHLKSLLAAENAMETMLADEEFAKFYKEGMQKYISRDKKLKTKEEIDKYKKMHSLYPNEVTPGLLTTQLQKIQELKSTGSTGSIEQLNKYAEWKYSYDKDFLGMYASYDVFKKRLSKKTKKEEEVAQKIAEITGDPRQKTLRSLIPGGTSFPTEGYDLDSIRKIIQEEVAKGSAGLFPTVSAPAKHHGGVISKTGPVFAQKGEVFFPKHFADGGPIHDSIKKKFDVPDVAKTLNTMVEININSKSLEDAIKKLEDLELKVEDKELKVEDKTFEVEDKEFTATIEVDASTAADQIQTAINNSKVSVDATATAVGADAVDAVARRVDELNVLFGNMQRQMDTVAIGEPVDVQGTIEMVVANKMSDINQKMNEFNSDISNLESTVTRNTNITRNVVTEVERKITNLQTVSNIRLG